MEISQAILDQAGKIGIIYSKSDEGEYTLQVCENGQCQIISDRSNHAKLFDSMESAKSALKQRGVEKAFMALDNTYDEFGDFEQEDHQSSNESRHDYMPISLD